MASEIRVNKLNSQTGVGTITLSPTGVDISGITTTETLKATTGIVTTLTATTGIVTTFEATTGNITTGNITTLRAPTGIVTSLEATTGNITTLRAPTGIVTTFVTNTAKVGGGVTISESGIEASGIGITVANINGGKIGGRKNLVINGAMSVAQRGSSSTSQGYHTVDRFKPYAGGADENPTQAHVDVSSGTSPYAEGFRKALKITNGNQTGGAGGADYMQIEHKFEAYDIANSGWNYTSSSSFITLSCWIKSSVSQDFQMSLRTSDGTAQQFQFETPTLSANTWTKVVKTIPGNSNLQFDNNVSQGLVIYWFPYIGNNYTSSSNTLNAWVQGTPSTYGVTDPTTWWTTNDATFELTGVQLEVGSQATAFEHRTFGDELALCQRYFQVLKSGTAVGSGSNISIIVPLFTQMRTTPSLGKTSGNFNFGDMVSQGFQSSSSPTIDGGYLNQDLQVTGYIGGFSGPTNYRPYRHEPTASDGALITANAEL